MTYAEAMAEIEAILAKMNEANPDIDALAGQVRRAGELIRFCRERRMERIAVSRAERRGEGTVTGAVAVPLPARPVFGLWFPFRRVAVVLSGGFSGCRRLTDRERRLGQVLGALLRCG